MNKKTYLIILPLLVLAVAALTGCIRGVTGDSLAPLGEHDVTGDSGATSDTHLPNDAHVMVVDHVSVDPRLVADLEESEWVSVRIVIAMPPGFEWVEGPHDDAYVENVKAMDSERWERFDQGRAEYRAEALTELGSDYKEVDHGDHINAAGLEKLRNSVLYVTRVGGSYDDPKLAEIE